MRVFSNENFIFKSHIIDKKFTYEFQENAKHRQLNSFNMHQRNANVCEFLQFLSTFHQSVLEIRQTFNSNDQKKIDFE